MECFTFKFCNYLDLFSLPVALAQAKYVITAFNSKWKKKKLAGVWLPYCVTSMLCVCAHKQYH